MDLGPQEIIIIILLIVVLFGVTWAYKNKRLPGRSGGANASAKDKNDQT
jgi:hypothetical protein